MVSRKFVEIYRDEDSKQAQVKLLSRYVVRDLEPSTTYTFRLRGYNAFGYSPYAHAAITTHPVSPASPVLEKASVDMVTMNWENDEKQISTNGEKCIYIVEQCIDMNEDTWKVVSKLRAKQVTVAQLDVNKTYIFRVYAVNDDGVESLRSSWTAMNTLLPKPPAVRLAGKNTLSCNSFELRWSRYDTLNQTRGSGTTFDRGRASTIDCSLLFNVFSTFDESGKGTIHPMHLPDVLHKLGVKNLPWRISDALDNIDRCEHGRIHYLSFEKWWMGDFGPTYLLYRCEGSPSKDNRNERMSLRYDI